MPALPPGVFTNITPPPPQRPINILLLDTLNTPMTDQVTSPATATGLPEECEARERASPSSVSPPVSLSCRASPTIPKFSKPSSAKTTKVFPLLQDPVGIGGSQSNMSEDILGGRRTHSMGPAIRRPLQNAAAVRGHEHRHLNHQSRQIHARRNEPLARYLVWPYPAAKISSGSPARSPSTSSPIPAYTGHNPFAPFSIVASSDDEFRETTDMLSRSRSPSIPSTLAALLSCPPPNAAESNSSTRRKVQRPGNSRRPTSSSRPPTSTPPCVEMAYQTGGHAFIDTNGLTQAVATAIADGSSYYTITYTPTEPTGTATFRKIQVQLQQQGLDLTYRRGYYANDPDAPAKRQTHSSSANPHQRHPRLTTTRPMRTAMMRGSPTPRKLSSRRASSLPTTRLPKTPSLPATRRIHKPSTAPIAATSSTSPPTHAPSPSPSPPTAPTTARSSSSPSSTTRTAHSSTPWRHHPDRSHPRRLRKVSARRHSAPAGDQRSRQRHLLPPHRRPRSHQRSPRCHRSPRRTVSPSADTLPSAKHSRLSEYGTLTLH